MFKKIKNLICFRKERPKARSAGPVSDWLIERSKGEIETILHDQIKAEIQSDRLKWMLMVNEHIARIESLVMSLAEHNNLKFECKVCKSVHTLEEDCHVKLDAKVGEAKKPQEKLERDASGRFKKKAPKKTARKKR